MTQDEIRKLLGGYATNALSADERRILIEAALEDQELFNALQNEDALKELLDDPMLRDQVRRALVLPVKPTGRARFSWRQWAFGVAMPAAAAVIVIVFMNRANAPKLISMSQPTVAPAASPAPSPKTAPNEVAPKLAAPPPAARKRTASIRAPQAQAIPAPVQIESPRRFNAPLAFAFRAADVRPTIPAIVRQQFAAGFAPNAPLYQGPLVRYSVVRSGPDGNGVRVEVSTQIAGYLALYQVDRAGNSKRVYPSNESASDPATLVAPGVTIQIPNNPIKIADAGERLRLVVVPAAPSAAIGQLGGAVNGAVLGTGTPPLQAPPTPLIVDIPLAAN